MREIRTRMEHHLHAGLHEITHWLYDPAAWGRTDYAVRFPWLHLHLIPGRLLNWACDRYDRRLGLTEAEIRRVQPTSQPERTFADGVRQLGEQLDRQASTRPAPCPACSRADQAGLSAAELHAGCAEQT